MKATENWIPAFAGMTITIKNILLKITRISEQPSFISL